MVVENRHIRYLRFQMSEFEPPSSRMAIAWSTNHPTAKKVEILFTVATTNYLLCVFCELCRFNIERNLCLSRSSFSQNGLSYIEPERTKLNVAFIYFIITCCCWPHFTKICLRKELFKFRGFQFLEFPFILLQLLKGASGCYKKDKWHSKIIMDEKMSLNPNRSFLRTIGS